MKPETKIWIRCESIGRPADGFTMNCSTRDAIKASAEWLMGVYMGSKIRITIARTEEELSDNKRSSNVSDMMNDLESIIGGSDYAHEAGIDRATGGTPEQDSSQ